MIIVSDVLAQVGRVLGTCDNDYVMDVLTRAVELLANKPTKTNVLWDPLLIYVDLPIVSGFYVCLPPHVEKPIKINISKQPAFTRNQFFEFSMNGPGTADPESGWSWQDRGWKPLQKPWPTGGAQFIVMSTNGNDTNTPVLLNTINQDQSTTWVTAAVGTAGPKIYGLLEVSKPVTQGSLQLYAGPYVMPSALVATWTPAILYPQFEWIKLSQTGVSCKILARRRTYHITQPTDVIPLSNRQAVITACIAIKSYDTLNWDDGATAEQNALRFLDEDQAARNLFQRVSNIAETSPTLNLNINTRDAIIAADLYDFACDVFGPIGQQKIFDRMTEAIELLANLSQWDPLIGYVDIQTWDSFYLTLPQYVDQVLAINVNKSVGTFRNQWFEFHMNGLGQDNDNADQVGSNRPCGGWEEVGEMPCAFPLQSPSYLVAAPASPSDNATPIRVYGIDQNDLPIYGQDGNLGVPITCEQGSFDISSQQLPFKRIDRIVLGSPQSFIELFATDGTQYLQNLGIFWPNIAEPKFRVIKIGQKAVTVRLRYRKRWVKITSLTDPVHMRSRSAMMNAMRSIMTATQDPNTANLLLMAAKDQLNKEWRATHPHEELTLQFDPGTWGPNFVQMPALCPILLLSSIQGLIPIGIPLHISWLIPFVIIDAFKSQPWSRRLANIAIKNLKRFLPFWAHRNPSHLIVSNFFASARALGAKFHVLPSQIDLRAAHGVPAPFRSSCLTAQASATLSMIASQYRTRYKHFLTAVTGAKPKGFSFRSGSDTPRYDKAAKSLPNQVDCRAHPGSDPVLVGVPHL